MKYRVYVYDARRRVWVLDKRFEDRDDAYEQAEMHRHKGRRARVLPLGRG